MVVCGIKGYFFLAYKHINNNNNEKRKGSKFRKTQKHFYRLVTCISLLAMLAKYDDKCVDIIQKCL